MDLGPQTDTSTQWLTRETFPSNTVFMALRIFPPFANVLSLNSLHEQKAERLFFITLKGILSKHLRLGWEVKGEDLLQELS